MVLEMQFRCTEILYHREREIAIQGRGFFAAFGGGGGSARGGVRRGGMLPGGSRGMAASRRQGQKGVQDTTKDVVSYTPSCDSP